MAKDDKTIASTMRYQVHLSESANFSPSSTTLKFEQRGGLATQLTGLKASTTYFVKLVVIDEDNAQTVSAEKSVTTPAVAVTNQAPSNVLLGNVMAASQTAVDVSWTAASDDTTPANQLTYEVYLAEGGDFSPSASTLKFSGKNVLSTQLTGLKAATSYSIKLVVVDAQGAKTVSAEKSVTTPAVAVTNQAPSNVLLGNVTAASQTAVDVAWTAASDDTTPANQLTYEVHLAEGGDFSPSASTLKFSGKNVLSTQLTGLKASTSYSVKLVVVDAQGAKTVSAVKSIITQVVTNADFVLNPLVEVSSTEVDLSWERASNSSNMTYEVHLAEGGDFSPSDSTLKQSSPNVLSTRLTNLNFLSAYTFKVVAIDNSTKKRLISNSQTLLAGVANKATGLLNDTGISQCVSENNVMGNCDTAHLGGWFGYNQDAQVGRDALAAKGQQTKVGSGDAGFDFTKISVYGRQLQSTANQWSCVLDNHTGLMWENKTNDNGLHSVNNRYTWYSTKTSNNGSTVVVGFYNNDENTSSFVRKVNAQTWCGHKDWRLPNVTELQSIVHYGKTNPAIDTTYFYTEGYYPYWSSSSSLNLDLRVQVVFFNSGYVDSYVTGAYDRNEYYLLPVRLVRSSR